MATKRTLEENLALVKAKTEIAKVEKKASAVESPILPFWPETARRVPNLVLRNALFAATKDREFYGNELRVLASLEGHTVKATERMTQHDLDNLEMLLHLQRMRPLGSRVTFTAHGFLKAMGRPTGGSGHVKLHEDLFRLARVIVEIRWEKERKSYLGSLVAGFFRDDDSGQYIVTFNEDMMKLFSAGSTQIEFEQRQRLGKNTLAKWLQIFYASHEDPYPFKVETIHKLCGSETKALREFRRLLRAGLERLVEVGQLTSWIIENDLITVKKNQNLIKLKARH